MTASQRVTPGLKLNSAACSAQVVVVRPPREPVSLTCGGLPLTPDGEPAPATGVPDRVVLGKRYVDEASGLEVLCTKGGAGPLAADGRELVVKSAKPLPSSD